MIHKKFYTAATLSLIAIAFFSSCKDNATVVILEPINPIQNPSFESGGRPALQSWWISDTLGTRVVQDSTSPSGTWSLELFPGWAPQRFLARTYVYGQTGTGVYKLTIAMKNGAHPLMLRPYATFGILVNNRLTITGSISTDSSKWTTLSMFDTLSLQSTDTIAVELAGGACELCSGSTLFDGIILQRMQ